MNKYKNKYISIDGSHPNADGMKTLSSMVLRAMKKKKLDWR